jgi:hypothetical protein
MSMKVPRPPRVCNPFSPDLVVNSDQPGALSHPTFLTSSQKAARGVTLRASLVCEVPTFHARVQGGPQT